MKRKDFLRYMGAGALTFPGLLNGFNVKARSTSSMNPLLKPFFTDTDHVLVIIQMGGGNDGLNTVIPLDQFNKYANARETIYIPEGQVLPLNGVDNIGFHPSMNGLRTLFIDNKLTVIQSVGYPNPNYSHFRATDIWMTGADSDQILNTGWMGRYLKYEYPNYPAEFPNEQMPDPLALEIGYSQSLVFQGPLAGMGMAIARPEDFYALVTGEETPVPPTPAGDQLAYVRLIAKQSNVYGERIKEAYDSVTSQQNYPDTWLAAQLKIVARLIAGGLKTRVYMVNATGGYDTHDSQVDYNDHTIGQHAELLEELSGGIKAFMNDINYLGVQDRVLGMTFSEFGRRIISNGSVGTDHGAAAPMFVFGSSLNGGVIGDTPFIPNNPNEDDNIPMQYDFRSVYATMLKDWLCVPESDLDETMLQDFPILPFVNSPGCVSTDTHELNQQAGKKLISNYPNPFTETTNITFESGGGRVIIHGFNGAGKLVATPYADMCPIGTHTVAWQAGDLPSGLYYCRIQNGGIQQVGQMLKVRD